MSKPGVTEISISLLLMIALVILANPFKVLMPNSLEQLILICLLVVFLIFITLVWKENAVDERDYVHRMQAGRISFLVGSCTLMMGIILQTIQGSIDPWLVLTFALMVFSKIVARAYVEKHK